MLVLAIALLVQSPPADSVVLRHANGRVPPTLRAVRVERPPVLDGRLDDPVWAQAVPPRGFTQTDPLEGVPAPDSTTFAAATVANVAPAATRCRISIRSSALRRRPRSPC